LHSEQDRTAIERFARRCETANTGQPDHDAWFIAEPARGRHRILHDLPKSVGIGVRVG